MASFLSWTPPTAFQHPRIWINDTTGPTLAEVIANRNAQGTGSGTPWANLVSYEAAHRSHAMSYYGLTEYGVSHAAVWLLGEGVLSSAARLAAGNRAVTVMLGIVANYSGTDSSLPANSSTNRERLMMLGIMYDWMSTFSGFSTADKTTVRNGIVRFCARFLGCSSITDSTPSMDTAEFIWGHAHGDACTAIVGLAGILSDGTSAENTRWQGWMDYLLDMQDNGDGARFFPTFRYFARKAADSGYDGGTHKGSGDYSYVTKNEEFHNRMFEMMATALGMTTIWADEEWYQLWMDWQLWHLRSDFHSHMQGESTQPAFFSHITECHAMQVAQRNPATALGQACQWYHKTYSKNQVPGGTYTIWGPYYIWTILWEKASVVQTPPFLAAMNGGWQSKIFENVAKLCCRTGWGARLNSNPAHADYNKLDQDYSSATLCLPRFFIGTHQNRDAGHFDFCVRGKALLIKTGQYDGEQVLEYKYDGAITAAGRNPTQKQYDKICWTRSGTTITLYYQAHGYSVGQSCTVSDISETATTKALPTGSYPIVSVQANSFTITGFNQGATSGTCHVSVGGQATSNGPITTDPTGHRKGFQNRVVAHNCVGIHSVLEQSMVSAGGNYEHTYDDSLNFDSLLSGFSVLNAGGTAKTILNVGDQLWAKHPPTRPTPITDMLTEPQDLDDIVGAAKLAGFCKEGTYAHFSRGTLGGGEYAYAVVDCGQHYWTGKCTSYLRHWLWLGPNAIYGWTDAIIVTWDDITCVPDATHGKRTCVLRLHTPKAYTGTASEITLANGDSRGHIKVLLPSGVEKTDVEGFQIGATTLYAGEVDALGDAGHKRDGSHDLNRYMHAPTGGSIDLGDHRIELNPPTNVADVDFLMTIFGGTVAMGAPPAVALVEVGDDKGVRFHPTDEAHQVTILFSQAAPFGLTFETDIVPAAPTGLAATVVSQTRIDLDWDDNAEADLDYYQVMRSKWDPTTETWGAYASAGTPTASNHSDTGLDPGTTYRYYVIAVDTDENASGFSSIVSATTLATPPVSATGAGSAPWQTSRRYSKYLPNLG